MKDKKQLMLGIFFVAVAVLLFFVLLAKAEPIGHSRLRAQVTGAHSVSLSWSLSADDTTTNCAASTAGCVQNVYRGAGACATSTVFTDINTPVDTAIAFVDAAAVPGNWCYGVSFTINGVESVKDTVSVSLQPAPPTGASATGH